MEHDFDAQKPGFLLSNRIIGVCKPRITPNSLSFANHIAYRSHMKTPCCAGEPRIPGAYVISEQNIAFDAFDSCLLVEMANALE